jgi:sugar lactone lactonase YvrE
LATLRGAKATASANLKVDSPLPSLLLHQVEGEIRYDNKYGPCWWMVELPQSWKISDVRMQFRNVITSIGFDVKLAQTEPADWARVPVAASFKGATADATNAQRVAQVEFKPVEAKFVRIEFKGHDGGENGPGQGSGHQDLVISGLQVWGPENPAISPAISLAQAAWAGGSCTLHDTTLDEHKPDGTVETRAPRGFSAAVDDNDPASPLAGQYSGEFYTAGSPAAEVEQTDVPADIVVTLKHRALVEAVGFSSMRHDRTERPRDMKIYTSPFSLSDDWTLQKELKDIAGGEYEEIAFKAPALAKRVRFEVGRVWNPNIDASRKVASGRIAELYVYGKAVPEDIVLNLKQGSQLTTQILDKDGRIVRTIDAARPVKPGPYSFSWDGLDDRGNKMPPGKYNARVLQNPTVYTTAGVIGNTAQPPTVNQNPADIESVAVDAAGNIYTANLWEEAAQDFRKVDRDTGNHVYDSHASIRNGSPNALPYAIAVDDKYLYCSTTSHANHQQQHLRRFRLSDGEPAPFPALAATNGHILLHEQPEKEIPAGTPDAVRDIQKQPLLALAAANGKLFATDALAGKVLVFDRETGAAAGSFDVKLPHALAIDSAGQLWVGHEAGKVTVFSQDGKKRADVLAGLGHVRSLAFGPGDTLYAADSKAGKILVYQTDPKARTAKLLRTFGGPARPGDYAPDRFYALKGATVDAQGNLTVAQGFPTAGSRLTRFSPDGKVLWDQVGTEFCSTGNTSQERPDEVVSHYFNRYQLDKQTGQWQFRGNVLASDPKWIRWHHGPMRRLEFGGVEFLFQSYGDGLQVYRRSEDGSYRLCSMFGRNNPFPDGSYRDTYPDATRPPETTPWSWHDANGNGTVDEEEITRLTEQIPDFNYFNFGVTVDRKGNALLCNDAITEIPMTGLDERGNPIYDLNKLRIIMRRDPSDHALIFQPVMAVRADDGSLYATAKSKLYPAPPEAGGGWMCGWVLARFGRDDKMLWAEPLPEACPGMDVIPGPDAGVMLVTIKWKDGIGSEIYHYAADGALIGITAPSKKFLGNGGIPDNTGSLAISRDPRDGKLDVFVEDCVGNRIRWQRVDDRARPSVFELPVVLKEPGLPLARL